MTGLWTARTVPSAFSPGCIGSGASGSLGFGAAQALVSTPARGVESRRRSYPDRVLTICAESVCPRMSTHGTASHNRRRLRESRPRWLSLLFRNESTTSFLYDGQNPSQRCPWRFSVYVVASSLAAGVENGPHHASARAANPRHRNPPNGQLNLLIIRILHGRNAKVSRPAVSKAELPAAPLQITIDLGCGSI